jgi:hypothetical protein
MRSGSPGVFEGQHQGGVADRRGSKAGVPVKRSGPFMQRMDQDRPDAGDLRLLKRCETGVASHRRAQPFALPGLVNGQPVALSAAALIGSLLRPAGGHQRGPVAGVRRGRPTPWPGVGQGRRADPRRGYQAALVPFRVTQSFMETVARAPGLASPCTMK